MCLAVPGRLTSVTRRAGSLVGEVDHGGVRREVCLELLPDVRVGEFVVVHAGFAVRRLDEESARETLALLGEVDLTGEQVGDEAAPGRGDR